MARHRAYHLAQAQQDPQDWRRIEMIYEQVKRAWQHLADDEAVLAFVHALKTYQERRGLWDDRIEWLHKALAAISQQDRPKEKGDLLNQLGTIQRLHGHWEEAIASHTEALNICQRLGDQQGMGDALEGQAVPLDLRVAGRTVARPATPGRARVRGAPGRHGSARRRRPGRERGAGREPGCLEPTPGRGTNSMMQLHHFRPRPLSPAAGQMRAAWSASATASSWL